MAEVTPLSLGGRVRECGIHRYSESVFDSYNMPLEEVLEALGKKGYSLSSHIKMVVFDLKGSDIDWPKFEKSCQSLNEGRSCVFAFGDFAVDFLFTKGPRDFSTLNHDPMMDSLEANIHQPYGVLCGISQMYEDLRESASAFKQAIYALELREYYRREMHIMREDHYREIAAGAAFEQVVPYYLVEENCVDAAFVDFCLSHGFLTAILADDIRNNTKNFQILWFYLAYEGNASSVGKRMFMHRNSVIYHLNQMSERYDFNLDRRFFREKLLLDFRLVFMNLSEASLNALFDN